MHFSYIFDISFFDPTDDPKFQHSCDGQWVPYYEFAWNGGTPIWMVFFMENPTRMDLGVALF